MHRHMLALASQRSKSRAPSTQYRFHQALILQNKSARGIAAHVSARHPRRRVVEALAGFVLGEGVGTDDEAEAGLQGRGSAASAHATCTVHSARLRILHQLRHPAAAAHQGCTYTTALRAATVLHSAGDTHVRVHFVALAADGRLLPVLPHGVHVPGQR
jgi:hypothetical protein